MKDIVAGGWWLVAGGWWGLPDGGGDIRRWDVTHVQVCLLLMKLDPAKCLGHGVTDVFIRTSYGLRSQLFCCCPIQQGKLSDINMTGAFGGRLGRDH